MGHGSRAGSRRSLPALAGVLGVALLASACGVGLAPKLGNVTPQYAAPPQWPLIGDPSVLPVGNHFYVFGSNTSKRLPVEVVGSLRQAYNLPTWASITTEGMPQKPAWAYDNVLWAPTVARFPSGYVLFFSAHLGSPNLQCIGRAISSAPGGPYVAEPFPFSCGLDGHRGALDPQLFQAPDGSWYLHAAFGDTESPIYAIPLDGNGNAPRNGPNGMAPYWGFPVLGKQWPWEGRFIENPSMIYDASTNTYLLAYSAGDWWTPTYATGLARCSGPLGPCSSNPGGPWLTNGSGRTGVGGLSFFWAGGPKAVYASFAAGNEGGGRDRAGTVASVALGNAPALGPP